ncbi:hypothetical protein [Prescottella equi]|uniref:hypothetical protein n=1 Tax=Rhodococcus hoagii TaxID=43767 RepID=UPI000A0FF196|nr:hypothetical protein [Prescottella equi]ORL96635.1 hypothetical protein A5N69_15320 [Prescottella equi]ORM16020.1 hypothetical protein A5N74_19640 [Prescottella equi]
MTSSIVNNLDTWSALGISLPKEITTQLDTLEAARYTESPYAGINLDTLTAKNVSGQLEELANTLSVEAKFAEAKQRVVRQLDRRIVNAVQAFVPDAIEQIQPGFDRAVSEYAEAVQKLPEDLCSDALVKAGPDALVAYQAAVAAVGHIRAVDSWVASLTELPVFVGATGAPTTRVLAPTNRQELSKLLTAHQATVDSVTQAVDPRFAEAVRLGIKFEIHTPTEAVEIVKTIEDQPVEKVRKSFRSW